MGAGGVSGARWPGHLCRRVGVSVSIGGESHGSTGGGVRVLVVLGMAFRLALRPGEKGKEDGEGSERRPVEELVVGESVVQFTDI